MTVPKQEPCYCSCKSLEDDTSGVSQMQFLPSQCCKGGQKNCRALGKKKLYDGQNM